MARGYEISALLKRFSLAIRAFCILLLLRVSDANIFSFREVGCYAHADLFQSELKVLSLIRIMQELSDISYDYAFLYLRFAHKIHTLLGLQFFEELASLASLEGCFSYAS